MIGRKQLVGGDPFPVGSIFIAVVATDPGTLLGYGTWTTFGAGRMLVGIDPGDPDFDTVLETGGSKTAAHQHGPGTLAPSAHTGLAIDAHGTHQHPISTSTYATISPHEGTAVGDHNKVGDLDHQHYRGSLSISNHYGAGVLDHQTSEFNHNHTVSTVSGNCIISAHDGTDVATHSIHTHNYYTTLNHTHTIAAGQGSHSHPQRSFSSTSGAYHGAITDPSASGPGTESLNTSSATLPQMVTQAPAGAPSYGTTSGASIALSHNVTNPDPHTISGSTELASALTAPLVHSVSQPASHILSGDIGTTLSTGVVTHGITHPIAHTLGGSTDYSGANSHSIASNYTNHTMDGYTSSVEVSTVQPYIVVYMWRRTA